MINLTLGDHLRLTMLDNTGKQCAIVLQNKLVADKAHYFIWIIFILILPMQGEEKLVLSNSLSSIRLTSIKRYNHVISAFKILCIYITMA
jgi:hypothetical protein